MMNFRPRFLIWISATLAFLSAVPGTFAKPPNIVLIFADDLGWKDVGYQGAVMAETPHLDRLAAEGMVFSSGYAAAGNCAPSRACLLSGHYTPRHEVYAVGSTDRGPRGKMRVQPVPNRTGLAPAVTTVAEALRAAGYATGHFGKWHLAGKQGALPTEQGFDVSFDSFGEGPVPEGTESNRAGPPQDPKGVYTLTDRACAFMAERREGPFFVYLAHHAIHSPLQGRPESIARFLAKGASERDAKYAACTHDLDDSVGRLLAKLKELRLDEETLVVFTSDNGAVQASSQEPLRGSKGGYYEGGIRVPFLVRWPTVVKAGSRSEVPVINVDLFPTFLAAAGAALPGGTPPDGESLLPLLRGEGSLNRQAIFWHFPGYLDNPVNRGRTIDVRDGFRSRPVSVIRKGNWKLHLYHEEWALDGGRDGLPASGAVELYDLASDIGEHTDLAAERADKRDELLADLLSWQQQVSAKSAHQPNPGFGEKGKKGRMK